ncbi:very-long-chain (3R)-3-hydroxyacyl-CoA dehydratase [Daphnia magna]|uniref:very-long-chain (3R)-3-hydroxyacyl-CoA dehydratase n=1 Tax=Daphnia magna TaxID=35525 RepID=UPI001E1BC116|nr:very-long-chain (3R)-3-hydroxyacyl-CoA dehydratase [Daphnia magna]
MTLPILISQDMSSKGNPHPFVYWAQNSSRILLRVDLKDVKDPDVQVNENHIKFMATGVGARGIELYDFELELSANIVPMSSQYRVTARQIEISLKKQSDGWWPKLNGSSLKPSWLKIDFDKWRSEDDEDETELGTTQLDEHNSEHIVVDHMNFNLENLRKTYLFVYNLWQFLGFTYIFSILVFKYSRIGLDFIPTAYQSVHYPLKFCQLMQALEIFHPLFGYTKGSVMEPTVQVGGRSIILFCLIEAEERIQNKPVIFYLILCWSVIELFRYPYYMTRVYNRDFGIITWLRYTVWIPLYPLGFLCEGIVILRNIPYFEETEKFSVGLPNKWNFSFHFPTLMRMYLLFFFLPAMYTMMSYMSKQRQKKLKSPKKTEDPQLRKTKMN